MLVLVVPPTAVELSVVSTNAPFGMLGVIVRTAVVTPLSRAALHIGMPSGLLTVEAAPADTFRTDQSAAAVSAVRQTGSENVTVIRFLDTVKLWNVGFVVSANT